MSRAFRVWDKQVKSYESDREFVLSTTGELMELCSNHNGTWQYHFANTDRFVVEQCTGLKDENGKDIYLGDIVRVPYGFNYEVEQLKSGAWVIGRDNLCMWVKDLKVVGNIHEGRKLFGEEDASSSEH